MDAISYIATVSEVSTSHVWLRTPEGPVAKQPPRAVHVNQAEVEGFIAGYFDVAATTPGRRQRALPRVLLVLSTYLRRVEE